MNNFAISFSSFFISLVFISCCGNQVLQKKWVKETAPEIFKARFETTKGVFDIEAQREWSPDAVDRLYQLIKSEFYTDIALYRVVPNFVAQFGIHNETCLNKAWEKHQISDEPVIVKNEEGTISFARDGKNSRTTQLFINLKSNTPRLDTLNYNKVKGFPVVAKVIDGMDVIKSFYNGYSEQPSGKQDLIQKNGNTFLRKNFPELDYINRAYIIN